MCVSCMYTCVHTCVHTYIHTYNIYPRAQAALPGRGLGHFAGVRAGEVALMQFLGDTLGDSL